MMSLILAILLSVSAWADPGSLVTNGSQTNASANTVLATTGPLSCRGSIGCNYRVALLLTSSTALTMRLEALNGASVVQQTINVAVPANDSKIVSLPTAFFVPNGYTLRVLNNTAQILGATCQASIVYEVTEIN